MINGSPSILYQWDSGLWGGITKNIPYRMTVTRTHDRLIINFRGVELFYQLDSIPGLNETFRNGLCGFICNSQTAGYSDFVQEAYSKQDGQYSGMINMLDALRFQYDQSFNNHWFEAHVNDLLRIHNDYKFLAREDFYRLTSTDTANSTCRLGNGVATNGIWYSMNYDLPENISDVKIIAVTEKHEGCVFDSTTYDVAIDFDISSTPDTYTWQSVAELDTDIVTTTGSLVKFKVNIPNNINVKFFIALIGKNKIEGIF